MVSVVTVFTAAVHAAESGAVLHARHASGWATPFDRVAVLGVDTHENLASGMSLSSWR